MHKNKSLLALIGTVILLVSLAVPMMQCAPEEEEEVGSYEEYVASLPEGCFPVPRDCFEQAMEEGELNIYDWAEWWPEELFSNFTKEFGIKITRDHFASGDEMLTKIQLHPEAEYDLIIIGQYGFMRLFALDLLKEVNWNWVPNPKNHIAEPLMWEWSSVGFEKGGVPYIKAIDVYTINTELVDDPRMPSWSVLLEPDEKYRGRITMLNDMFETVGMALFYLGYSPNSNNEEELMEARDLLLKQKPYLYGYDTAPRRLMMEEEIWMQASWDGDRFMVYAEGYPFEPIFPSEGSFYSLDAMFMPIGGPHPAAAHLFINYTFRPQVNTLLINIIGYSPTSTAVKSEDLSEALRSWFSLYPSEEYLEKCELLTDEGYHGEGLRLRTAIWEELIGG